MGQFSRLLDVQIGSKSDIQELSTKEDSLQLNLYLISIYLAKMLPIIAIKSFEGKVAKGDKLVDHCAVVIQHLLALCNHCNVDIPDESYIKSVEADIPLTIKNDSCLLIMSMLSAISNITSYIFVESAGAVWTEEELPEQFEDDICSIVVGVKLLGDKHGFTIADVLA